MLLKPKIKSHDLANYLLSQPNLQVYVQEADNPNGFQEDNRVGVCVVDVDPEGGKSFQILAIVGSSI